ncbi:MAG: Hsp20/alpha crystallin family protein [Acidobacteriota bacterium]|nr:Hsp20/alpha crystallin family protein [Acidobacteriota bacterium]
MNAAGPQRVLGDGCRDPRQRKRRDAGSNAGKTFRGAKARLSCPGFGGAPEGGSMLGLFEPKRFYRDLFDFRRDFDEIFNRMIGATATPGTQTYEELFAPPVGAWTDTEAKKFYLHVAVPGIDPKEVKIELQGNVLTISGERKKIETKKELTYHQREFTYGAFQRMLTLPEGVDAEKLTAEFNNGVLEITAPLAAAALPRRIEIKPALKKAA